MQVPENCEDPKKIALDILTDMNLEFRGGEITKEYKRKDNTLIILLLALLAAPIALPIIVGIAGIIIGIGAAAIGLVFAAAGTLVSLFFIDVNLMTKLFFFGGALLASGAAILLIEFIRFVVVAIGREVSIRLRRRDQ